MPNNEIELLLNDPINILKLVIGYDQKIAQEKNSERLKSLSQIRSALFAKVSKVTGCTEQETIEALKYVKERM